MRLPWGRRVLVDWCTRIRGTGKRDDDKKKNKVVNKQNKGNNCGVGVPQRDKLGLGYWLVNPPIYNNNNNLLEMRRQEFLLRYYFKLKSHIQNPAYASVVNTRLQLYFDCRREGGTPVIMRTKKAIEKYNLPTQHVLPYITPSKYSLMVENPEVNSEVASFRKYSTPFNILKAAALEIISTYENY